MADFTYVECFAGAGGLSRGLDTAGWSCLAHAEIEPHARAVLRRHWPDVPLYGDVSAIDGRAFAGVTLLSGGSPCQDLSVAGKRAGMTEGSGTRSSLYFEQVRLWQESQAPYFLWENVLGALSSNHGRDFAAVLSALVGAAVPVPADGWQSAGVAAGPTGVAAWRVLDARYFGVPQRRRRVFVIGARTGGVDPAEVLAVSEGLRGDSPPRREAREGAAGDAGGGARGAGAIPLLEVTARQGMSAEGSAGIGADGDPMFTLTGKQHGVMAVNISDGAASLDPVIGTLGARSGGQEVGAQTRGVVLAYDTTQVTSAANRSNPQPGDPCHPLTGAGHPLLAVTYDARGNGDGGTVNTLAGDNQNRVTDYTAIVMRQREGKPGGGKGPLLSVDQSLTLGTGNDQVLFATSGQANAAHAKGVALALNATHEQPVIVSPTLNTTHFGKHAGCNQHVAELAEILPATGIPRRLMPVECERLMGWPDGATAEGIAEDGTRYALSDTARYRLCGNGCAAPVVAWIGWRLRLALERGP